MQPMAQRTSGRKILRRLSTLTVTSLISAGIYVGAVLPATEPTPAFAEPCDPMGSSAVDISVRLANGSTLSSMLAGSSDSSRQWYPGENYIGSSTPPFLPGQPTQLPVIAGHTQALSFLTGPGAPAMTNDRFDIAATDLGISYADQWNNTVFLFGDTFACNWNINNWRSNTLVRTTDHNFDDGIGITEALTQRGFQGGGRATQVIASKKVPGVEFTTIPTAGITVGGAQYIDFMSVRDWGDTGPWNTNFAATARSFDGVNWEVMPNTYRTNLDTPVNALLGPIPHYRPGNEKLQQSAFMVAGDFVYRYTTGAGRATSAVVGRSPLNLFPDENSFTYWDGRGWNPDPAAAVAVMDGEVSEFSVQWNGYLNKFISLQYNNNGIVLRTAPNPEGPWDDRRMVIDPGTLADAYGPFLLPNQTGPVIYWTLSTWSSYNVMEMRTDLRSLFAERPDSWNEDALRITDWIRYPGK